MRNITNGTGQQEGHEQELASDCIGLHAELDGDQVHILLTRLQQAVRQGQSVVLLADGVKKISTLALQVLLAATATSARHNLSFAIETPSPEFLRACADTGLRDHLNVRG